MAEGSASDRGASKVALSICAMLTKASPLLLASGSPRRREMLARVGVPLLALSVDVDESVPRGMGPDDYLVHVVGSKRLAAGVLLEEHPKCPALLVADTVVVADDCILGKPRDDAHARDTIGRLSGRTHRVITRYAVQSRQGDVVAESVTTEVTFRPLATDEIDHYVATGEGRDKAGGYAIQGIGAALVVAVAGSYTSVVGLPLAEVVVALRQLSLWPSGLDAA